MRKSALFKTASIFGPALQPTQAGNLTPALRIQDGTITYRKTGSRSCIEQDFKGYLGYLQHFDWVIDRDAVIPVVVKQRDIYAIYAIRTTGRLHLSDSKGWHIAELRKRRARYIYLPPGDYTLHVSAGRHQLFYFYFSIGIFDGGADDTFDFLKPLLEAHRQQSCTPLASRDFGICPVTESYIQFLCKQLKKGDLDSQIFIIDRMKELVKLSLQKIKQEHEPRSHTQALAESAKALIEINTEADGIQYKLDTLADKLNISLNYLHIVFKAETGMSLRKHINTLVCEHAKKHLHSGQSILETAYLCGFADVSGFYKFFKRQTGLTPKQFIDQQSFKN